VLSVERGDAAASPPRSGNDPELAETFHPLTPGRHKSYVIHLSSAKKPETRVARIAKSRDEVLAVKGANAR
jgi:uncharacterized protein YdeI (YjbR/CyaY-like superfamily)